VLKLTVGVLAVVLAGSASAAGWRSLRIDASSEDAFDRSVSALTDKLPRVRRVVFERSLQDIWVEGVKAAQAGGRDYTVTDYLRELDGLGYKEVVEFTDPSGDTAERYFDQAYTTIYDRRPPQMAVPNAGASKFPGWSSYDPPNRTGPAGAANHVPGVNPWQQ
jgi:hypothetical protein